MLKSGTVTSWLIRITTGRTPNHGCQCKKRIQKMNKWGWWLCLTKRRKRIATWLSWEAKRMGRPIPEPKMPHLIWTGIVMAASRWSLKALEKSLQGMDAAGQWLINKVWKLTTRRNG